MVMTCWCQTIVVSSLQPNMPHSKVEVFFIAFVRREPISQFISGIITGIFIVDVSFIYWTKLKHVEVNVWLKF